MDAREEADEQIPRHVVEDVEGGHRVERVRLDVELRDVTLDELGAWNTVVGAPELLGREVDAGEAKALGERPRLLRAATAPELQRRGRRAEAASRARHTIQLADRR